jgi:recombinational DNA repair protein RecR
MAPTQYKVPYLCQVVQNKESEVCRTCSMHGRDKKYLQILKGRESMRDLGNTEAELKGSLLQLLIIVEV